MPVSYGQKSLTAARAGIDALIFLKQALKLAPALADLVARLLLAAGDGDGGGDVDGDDGNADGDALPSAVTCHARVVGGAPPVAEAATKTEPGKAARPAAAAAAAVVATASGTRCCEPC